MPLEIHTIQTAPPIIWFHVACASASVVLGAWILGRRKGTTVHRWLGRFWVLLMLSTSLGSFLIQARGRFSLIHLLSVVTIIAISAAIYGALKHDLELHRKSMIGAYVGLIIAGVFTLLPYRMLGQLVFGSP